MSKYCRKRKHDNLNDITNQPHQKFKIINQIPEHMQRSQNLLFDSAQNFLKSLEEAGLETGQHSDIDSGVGEEDSDDGIIAELMPLWYEEDDGIDMKCVLDGSRNELLKPTGGSNKCKKTSHKSLPSYGRPRISKIRTENDSDDEIIHPSGFLQRLPGLKLPPKFLEYKRLKDVNNESYYSEGPVISSVEFHPSSPIALVAGTSGIATFYSVGGKYNKKLHSEFCDKFPISCAGWIKGGNEAVFSGKCSDICIFDLQTAKALRVPLPIAFDSFITSPDGGSIAVIGNNGQIHIVASESKELMYSLNQDIDISTMTYDSTGKYLFTHSITGSVSVWDINMRKVKQIFTDFTQPGTAISVSPCNQFIATGSTTGIVKLYNMEDIMCDKIQPRETIHTSMMEVNNLKFNVTSEILAFSSVSHKNAVKLFNLNSGSMFSNFPSLKTKLGYVNVMNFSPNSGYIAFGNKKSSVLLYRLKHYQKY